MPESVLQACAEAGEVRPDVADQLLGQVCLPNGTWKTTYPERLDDLNAKLLELLPRGRRLQIMDAAVSSGVSTLEWSDQLTQHGFDHQMVAGDLITEATITTWGRRFAVLCEAKSGRPLLFELGSRILPIASGHLRAQLARPILAPALRAIAWAGHRAEGGRTRRLPAQHAISLVSAALRGRPNVEVVEDDLTIPGRYSSRFDVIRAANLVQPSYFDETTLRQMIGNLKDRLRENGLLALCRTTEDGENRATVFRRRGPKLLPEVALNGGSEVSDLVLSS